MSSNLKFTWNYMNAHSVLKYDEPEILLTSYLSDNWFNVNK